LHERGEKEKSDLFSIRKRPARHKPGEKGEVREDLPSIFLYLRRKGGGGRKAPLKAMSCRREKGTKKGKEGGPPLSGCGKEYARSDASLKEEREKKKKNPRVPREGEGKKETYASVDKAQSRRSRDRRLRP